MPVDGQREPFVIPLQRGRQLVVRALDHAGKPIEAIISAFAEQTMDRYFSSEYVHDGLFRINAAQPGRTYQVLLFSGEAMAGIVTEIKAPEDGRTIDVRLQPCGYHPRPVCLRRRRTGCRYYRTFRISVSILIRDLGPEDVHS